MKIHPKVHPKVHPEVHPEVTRLFGELRGLLSSDAMRQSATPKRRMMRQLVQSEYDRLMLTLDGGGGGGVGAR